MAYYIKWATIAQHELIDHASCIEGENLLSRLALDMVVQDIESITDKRAEALDGIGDLMSRVASGFKIELQYP